MDKPKAGVELALTIFHKRLHFSSQAKERSTTQRRSVTVKVCSSLRLAICNLAVLVGWQPDQHILEIGVRSCPIGRSARGS
jgi:hypothetical protein